MATKITTGSHASETEDIWAVLKKYELVVKGANLSIDQTPTLQELVRKGTSKEDLIKTAIGNLLAGGSISLAAVRTQDTDNFNVLLMQELESIGRELAQGHSADVAKQQREGRKPQK
jgi:hypothetical protein